MKVGRFRYCAGSDDRRDLLLDRITGQERSAWIAPTTPFGLNLPTGTPVDPGDGFGPGDRPVGQRALLCGEVSMAAPEWEELFPRCLLRLRLNGRSFSSRSFGEATDGRRMQDGAWIS